eukprot:CCRYP_017852-RB/>CCRYP_017852-RB protein AED:0.05 eAED:0.05 QI:66/1/1/1/1/1/3/842/224
MITLHRIIFAATTAIKGSAAFGTTRFQPSSRHKAIHFIPCSVKLHSTSNIDSVPPDASPKRNYIYTQLDPNVNHHPYRRNLQHVLTTIENAAYSAGEVTLATAGKIAVKSTKANIRDLVTESDVQCQMLIKEIIMSEFPGDLFLGEEDVNIGGVGEEMSTSEALTKALGIAPRNDDGQDRLLFVVVSLPLPGLVWVLDHELKKNLRCVNFFQDPIDGTVRRVVG